MLRRVPSCWLSVLSACVTVACVGCTPGRSSVLTCDSLCCAGLDEYREIELSRDLLSEREGLEPEHKYERLVLRIRPRKSLNSNRVLKEIERKSGESGGELRFLDVAARTDEFRQKVWFVERSTGRIVATVNLQTGHATGPDDAPPAWAKADGGQLLDAPCEP